MREAIDKLEIRSIKELAKVLEIGEEVIAEEVMRVPEYPNIPHEVRQIKIRKNSPTTVYVERY